MSVDDLLARHAPEARLSAEHRTAVLTAVLGHADDSGADGSARTSTTGAHERDEVLLAPLAPHSRRRTVVPAVAAAAVVLAVAGVLAFRVADGPDRPSTTVTPVAARSVCDATLPSSWNQAYAKDPLEVDGFAATPVRSDAAGDVILQWFPRKDRVAYAVQRTDGTLHRVGTFVGSASTTLPSPGRPAPNQWAAAATDGRYVVMTNSTFSSTVTSRSYTLNSTTTDVMIVDLTTGARTHVLSNAATPKGFVIRSDIALWAGVVYWGSAPRGDDHRGVVVSYDIATRAHRVVADLKQYPEVVSDVRGVSWPGGTVLNPDVPSVLDPQLDAGGDTVDRFVTDGDHYAWQTITGDQTVIHWADKTGATRVYRVTRLDHGSDFGGPSSVAGPFVFLHVNTGGSGNSVLDVRTGAVAPLASGDTESHPGHRLYVVDGAFAYRTVNPARLPALHC